MKIADKDLKKQFVLIITLLVLTGIISCRSKKRIERGEIKEQQSLRDGLNKGQEESTNIKMKIEPQDLAGSTTVPQNSEVDNCHFRHYLPDKSDSGICYDIEIVSVSFIEKRNFFEISNGEYDLPEKTDGLNLSVRFKITNRYDRDMRIPFPKYFEISAPEFRQITYERKIKYSDHRQNGASLEYVYVRDHNYFIDNSAEIRSLNGTPLASLGTKYFDDIMVDFKAREMKEFVIYFTDPFPKNFHISVISLMGFNPSVYKGHSRRYSFGIDVHGKKLINLKVISF